MYGHIRQADKFRSFLTFLVNFDVNSDKPDFMINATANHQSVECIYARKQKNFHYLPTNIYRKFPNIFKIHVTQCDIKKISYSSFTKLKMLSILELDFNAIESIEEKSFNELQSLEILSLGSNRIKELPSDIFNFTFSLKQINLENNKIKYLSSDIFSNLKRLEIINFDHNSITNLTIRVNTNVILKSLSFYKNLIVEVDKTITYTPYWVDFVNFRNNTCINQCIGISPNRLKCLNDSSASKEVIFKSLKKCSSVLLN